MRREGRVGKNEEGRDGQGKSGKEGSCGRKERCEEGGGGGGVEEGRGGGGEKVRGSVHMWSESFRWIARNCMLSYYHRFYWQVHPTL